MNRVGSQEGLDRHFFIRNADILLTAATALLFNLHLLVTSDYFLGSGTDIVSLEYPLHAFASKWLSQGVIPLWNPTLFGGVPFQAGVHGYFYPGFLTGIFLDTGWDIKLSILVHLMLAAAGGAWFARSRCSHFGSRYFLGIVFSLSAFMTLHLYAGHRVLCATAALLPWAMGAVDRVIQKKIAALPTAVVIFGLVMLSGHYQMIFIFGLGSFLYLLLDAWLNQERPTRFFTVLRPAFVLLGLAAAGVLIAAVQMAPMITNVASSQRSGDDAAFAASFSASPSSLITYLFPSFFGNRVDTPFTGDFAYWESVGYIGIVPLLLVWTGFFVLPFRKILPSAAVIFVALILAMGSHTPLFDLYLTAVPGADLFRSPGRFALLVALFGGLIGALVIDRILDGTPLLSIQKRLAMISAWAPLMLAAGFSTTLSSDEISKAVALFFIGAALLTVAVWKSRNRKIAAAMLVAVTVGDLFHFGHRFMSAGTPDLFTVPEGLSRLMKKSSNQGARIIPPAGSRFSNYVGLYDLSTPGGYDIFINGRVAETLNRSQDRAPDSFLSIERLRRGSTLLRRFGANYLITSARLQNGANGTIQGFREFQFEDEAEGYFLYRDPTPDPRVALIHEMKVVADKEEMFRILESSDFNMKKRALIEEALPSDFAVPSSAVSKSESAIISHYFPNRVEIDTTAASDAVLILSDTYMQGWSATVDGSNVPMIAANYIMRAIPVPKGNHHVVMSYCPRSFVFGAIVSLLSVFAAIALLIFQKRGSRRTSAGRC
jgi:hypothetical protein